MADADSIRSDFNSIAALDEPKWDHNRFYYPSVLRCMPEDAGVCLDIGCGKGELSLLLVQKAHKVVAVDLAENMIAQAKALRTHERIEYVCGDILTMDFSDSSLDVIVTSATAHHLPYEWLLEFAQRTLKPGGRLVILDLAKASTPGDCIVWGFAALPNLIISLVKTGRLQPYNPQEKRAWEQHCGHDKYMTLREIRALARQHIPDARIRRKLFWRYTLVWEKPLLNTVS